MRIVFEYEEGPNVEIVGLKYYKINERSAENAVLDELLSDPAVVRMYIIADDNRIE